MANDQIEAFALCAQEGIDLLLTDVLMPVETGPALGVRITAVRPGFKILYMSGYTDDAIVKHGVLGPGTPFINKPFSPTALLKKVREVLDAQQPRPLSAIELGRNH